MTAIFQEKIAHLRLQVIKEGTLVEEALAKACRALFDFDTSLAQEVIDEDDVIDRMEMDIEDECLEIIALHQPVADDLRFLVAVLRINNDLERIGDIAGNIAKRSRYLAAHPKVSVPLDFPEMSRRAREMVKKAIDSLVNRDVELARAICAADEELDRMRNEGQEILIREMSRQSDKTETLVRMFAIVRHFERIGDMATHIAEDVIYLVEGEIVRHGKITPPA